MMIDTYTMWSIFIYFFIFCWTQGYINAVFMYICLSNIDIFQILTLPFQTYIHRIYTSTMLEIILPWYVNIEMRCSLFVSWFVVQSNFVDIVNFHLKEKCFLMIYLVCFEVLFVIWYRFLLKELKTTKALQNS